MIKKAIKVLKYKIPLNKELELFGVIIDTQIKSKKMREKFNRFNRLLIIITTNSSTKKPFTANNCDLFLNFNLTT